MAGSQCTDAWKKPCALNQSHSNAVGGHKQINVTLRLYTYPPQTLTPEELQTLKATILGIFFAFTSYAYSQKAQHWNLWDDPILSSCASLQKTKQFPLHGLYRTFPSLSIFSATRPLYALWMKSHKQLVSSGQSQGGPRLLNAVYQQPPHLPTWRIPSSKVSSGSVQEPNCEAFRLDGSISLQ